MQDYKLISRHSQKIVRFIGKSPQVSQPFGPDQEAKIMREMPLRPDVPGRHDQKKNRRIFPPQQPAKAYPCFAIKNREQNENRSGINDPEQTFGEASQRGKNPNTGEPHAATPPALITGQSTENRSGDERADQRLGHHNARQQKRPAEAEPNQTGNETAPVIGQLFADQKDKRSGGHYGERDRQPSRCLIHPENLVRRDDEPVEQRRFLQTRYSVVCWEQPLMALEHLARCSGILAFGLAI